MTVAKDDWTIMVYMASDNNLSVDMAYALKDIREAVKDAKGKINLFAYFDGYTPDVPTSYFDFSEYDNPRRLLSVEVEGKAFPVRNNGNVNENSAQARSVLNFVDWCVNKAEHDGEMGRRAENYALIFSGHSFGFQNIGLMQDESSNYYLSRKKLQWVLKRMTDSEDSLGKGEPILLGKPISILGFDSCVMGMLEVGYEFKDFATTMIASEGTVANAGWTYGKLLGRIARGDGNTVAATAKNLVVDFIADQANYTIGGVSIDMAAWDMTKIQDVAAAFQLLATDLNNCFADENSRLYKQMKRALLQVHWSCQSYMYDQNVDIKDFCGLLLKEAHSLEDELSRGETTMMSDIKRHCLNVMARVDECVILSGFCGGAFQYSNGMSLFFPWTWMAYNVSQESYESLDFVNVTRTEQSAGNVWNKFLKNYLGNVSLRPSQSPKRSIKSEIGYVLELGEVEGSDLQKLNEPFIYFNDEIPKDPKTKIPPNAGTKIPPNAGTKIPPNAGTKIPPNVGTRIPQDPYWRMGGGLGLFFRYFMEIKNIDAPWYIAGFTKDPDVGERLTQAANPKS